MKSDTAACDFAMVEIKYPDEIVIERKKSCGQKCFRALKTSVTILEIAITVMLCFYIYVIYNEKDFLDNSTNDGLVEIEAEFCIDENEETTCTKKSVTIRPGEQAEIVLYSQRITSIDILDLLDSLTPMIEEKCRMQIEEYFGSNASAENDIDFDIHEGNTSNNVPLLHKLIPLVKRSANAVSSGMVASMDGVTSGQAENEGRSNKLNIEIEKNEDNADVSGSTNPTSEVKENLGTDILGIEDLGISENVGADTDVTADNGAIEVNGPEEIIGERVSSKFSDNDSSIKSNVGSQDGTERNEEEGGVPPLTEKVSNVFNIAHDFPVIELNSQYTAEKFTNERNILRADQDEPILMKKATKEDGYMLGAINPYIQAIATETDDVTSRGLNVMPNDFAELTNASSFLEENGPLQEDTSSISTKFNKDEGAALQGILLATYNTTDNRDPVYNPDAKKPNINADPHQQSLKNADLFDEQPANIEKSLLKTDNIKNTNSGHKSNTTLEHQIAISTSNDHSEQRNAKSNKLLHEIHYHVEENHIQRTYKDILNKNHESNDNETYLDIEPIAHNVHGDWRNYTDQESMDYDSIHQMKNDFLNFFESPGNKQKVELNDTILVKNGSQINQDLSHGVDPPVVGTNEKTFNLSSEQNRSSVLPQQRLSLSPTETKPAVLNSSELLYSIKKDDTIEDQPAVVSVLEDEVTEIIHLGESEISEVSNAETNKFESLIEDQETKDVQSLNTERNKDQNSEDAVVTSVEQDPGRMMASNESKNVPKDDTISSMDQELSIPMQTYQIEEPGVSEVPARGIDDPGSPILKTEGNEGQISEDTTVVILVEQDHGKMMLSDERKNMSHDEEIFSVNQGLFVAIKINQTKEPGVSEVPERGIDDLGSPISKTEGNESQISEDTTVVIMVEQDHGKMMLSNERKNMSHDEEIFSVNQGLFVAIKINQTKESEVSEVSTAEIDEPESQISNTRENKGHESEGALVVSQISNIERNKVHKSKDALVVSQTSNVERNKDQKTEDASIITFAKHDSGKTMLSDERRNLSQDGAVSIVDQGLLIATEIIQTEESVVPEVQTEADEPASHTVNTMGNKGLESKVSNIEDNKDLNSEKTSMISLEEQDSGKMGLLHENKSMSQDALISSMDKKLLVETEIIQAEELKSSELPPAKTGKLDGQILNTKESKDQKPKYESIFAEEQDPSKMMTSIKHENASQVDTLSSVDQGQLLATEINRTMVFEVPTSETDELFKYISNTTGNKGHKSKNASEGNQSSNTVGNKIQKSEDVTIKNLVEKNPDKMMLLNEHKNVSQDDRKSNVDQGRLVADEKIQPEESTIFEAPTKTDKLIDQISNADRSENWESKDTPISNVDNNEGQTSEDVSIAASVEQDPGKSMPPNEHKNVLQVDAISSVDQGFATEVIQAKEPEVSKIPTIADDKLESPIAHTEGNTHQKLKDTPVSNAEEKKDQKSEDASIITVAEQDPGNIMPLQVDTKSSLDQGLLLVTEIIQAKELEISKVPTTEDDESISPTSNAEENNHQKSKDAPVSNTEESNNQKFEETSVVPSMEQPPSKMIPPSEHKKTPQDAAISRLIEKLLSVIDAMQTKESNVTEVQREKADKPMSVISNTGSVHKASVEHQKSERGLVESAIEQDRGKIQLSINQT